MRGLPVKVPGLDPAILQKIAQVVDDVSNRVYENVLGGMSVQEALKESVENQVKSEIKDAVMQQIEPLLDNDTLKRLANAAIDKAVDKAWDKIKHQISSKGGKQPSASPKAYQPVRSAPAAVNRATPRSAPDKSSREVSYQDTVARASSNISQETAVLSMSQGPRITFGGNVSALVMAPVPMIARLFQGIRMYKFKPGMAELLMDDDRLVFRGKAAGECQIYADVKTREVNSFFTSFSPFTIPLLVLGSIILFTGGITLVMMLGWYFPYMMIAIGFIALRSIMIVVGTMKTSTLTVRTTNHLYDFVTITRRDFSKGQDYSQFIESFWATIVRRSTIAPAERMVAPAERMVAYTGRAVAPAERVVAPAERVARTSIPVARPEQSVAPKMERVASAAQRIVPKSLEPAPVTPVTLSSHVTPSPPELSNENIVEPLDKAEVVTPAQIFLCQTCYEDFTTQQELEEHKKRENHA